MPVVPKDETAIFDTRIRLSRAGVIGILQQFRKDVSRILNLPEKQPPRAAWLLVAIKLIPPLAALFANLTNEPGFLARCTFTPL